MGQGCSSVSTASDRNAAGAGSIPQCGKGFLSQSQLSVQTLLRCPYTPVCNCIVHARVRWIMETLKHPAPLVGWVARLCRRWLSPMKATRIFHGRNPKGTMQLLKKSNPWQAIFGDKFFLIFFLQEHTVKLTWQVLRRKQERKKWLTYQVD